MTIEHDLRRIAMDAICANRAADVAGDTGPFVCRVAPVPLLALVQRCERLRGAIRLLLDARLSAAQVLTEDAADNLLVAEEQP